jgi:hypothetical protein
MTKAVKATLILSAALSSVGCANNPTLQNLGTAATNLGSAAVDAGRAGVTAVRSAVTTSSATTPTEAPTTAPAPKKVGVTWGEATKGKVPTQPVAARATSSIAWSSADGKAITVTVSDGKKDTTTALSATGKISLEACNRSFTDVVSQGARAAGNVALSAGQTALGGSGVVQDAVRRTAPATSTTNRTAPATQLSAAALTAPYAGLSDASKAECVTAEAKAKTEITAKASELSKSFAIENKGVKPVVTYTSADGADVILGLNTSVTGPTRAPSR